MQHHTYGFSSLHRRWACPGSAQVEQELSEEPTENEWTELGTRLHALTAQSIKAWLGEGMPPVNEVGELEDKDFEAVERAVEFFIDTYERFSEAMGVQPDVWIERRCELSISKTYRIWGWPDLALVVPGQAVVVPDWKFGFQPVDDDAAAWQTAGQVHAVMEESEATRGKGAVFHARLGELQETYFDLAEHDFRPKIREVVLEESSDLRAGHHCAYCRGLGRCDETVKLASDLPQLLGFEPSATKWYPPTEAKAKEVAESLVALLDVKRCRELAEKMHLGMAAWPALKARIKCEVELNPEAFPEWMVQTVSRPHIRDKRTFLATLRGIVSEDDVDQAVNLVFSRAEKAIGEVVGKEKKELREFMHEVFRDAIETRYSKTLRRKPQRRRK